MINPGCVAVIFRSQRTDGHDDLYAEAAHRMNELAARQPGYLGIESVRDPATGSGITVSYWVDDSAAQAWKAVAEHEQVQERGRAVFYRNYDVVVAQVQRTYSWSQSQE